jgi:hypothetical protein
MIDPRKPTQFTRESAERIARVVRAAELSGVQASPLTFAKRLQDQPPKSVRKATFSGAWPVGSSKVVTFSHAPTATASVTNLFWPISSSGYSNENCLVGREGTSWWLVVPVLQTATAVFVTQTASAIFATQTVSGKVISSMANQSIITGVSPTIGSISCLSDVSVSASLNTADCTISVSVSKTSASHSVVTGVSTTGGTIQVVNTTASAVLISGISSGAYVVNSSTAAYLRIRVP